MNNKYFSPEKKWCKINTSLNILMFAKLSHNKGKKQEKR
jgi:hypothetical protein